MKQRTLKILLVAAATILPGLAFGQAEDVNKIKLTAIKSVQIQNNKGKVTADFVMRFTNANNYDVQLRGATFTIFAGKSEQPATVIKLGDGKHPAIPILSYKNKPYSDNTLTIALGADEKEAAGPLLGLINLIGDTNTKKQFAVEGEADIGVFLENGWAYQKSVEIKFLFIPDFQDEVLLSAPPVRKVP